MRARVLALVSCLLLLAGCGMLPTSGVVHHTAGSGDGVEEGDARFSAPGPADGDDPVAIVNGFLQAMTANPATTSVARSYLSRDARGSWNPTRGTVVYSTASVTQRGSQQVRARLADPRLLDSRGSWLGSAPAAAGRLSLQVVREDGQWRITDPPDELLVPDWFLDQRYQPYNLYYFDPSEQTLVPDRVYVPRGEQAPSQLVRALLNGPGPGLSTRVRTEFPPQTQLNLSVVVADDGTAEIPLSGPSGDHLASLPSAKLSRAAAQLAWTLRQVPGVSRLRITVGDTAITLPDGRRDFSAQSGNRYAPTVATARSALYGLRKGRLVVRTGTTEQPVAGAFGTGAFVLRSFAVRLDGGAVAGVSGNGRMLYVSRRLGAGADAPPPSRVYAGADLLRPGYDMFGTLWWVDDASSGARVYRMVDGTPTPVRVPGVSGAKVKSFTISRDGTSLVAVVDATGGDQVIAAGLERTADGDVVGALPGRSIGNVPDDLDDLRDVVWRSPNDLAVLGRLPNGVFEVLFVSLDGSPGDPRAVPPDTRRGEVTGLVGAPDSTLPLYLVLSGGQLLRLDDSSRWAASGIPKGLVDPAYVG
ncbi:hypothetical protein D9V37_08405 [Nocardioides mangrovicus]|uniref:GerMN domain-containing protein n=1 Tax=Nocardioides mangrovicus TaxID=2478913 RepID=A0A3L8P3Q8_9ACTN|nr:LpqB family beta-propeller domain-containing protein [Nocardioides mangrovicus]RLV49895.1 hypothetical protein D9V37_08405 [Nocardioides mangrovicus]